MHPNPRKRVDIVRSLGLRNFILVVRELQVHAAAMDVNLLAQVSPRHCAALDVPTGTARTPRAFPCRFARFLCLPQREILRPLLKQIRLLPTLNDGTFHSLFKRAVVQLPIFHRLRNSEVDRTARFIRRFLVNQLIDHVDDLINLLTHPRVHIGAAHIEAVHHFEVGINILLRQVMRLNSKVRCTRDYLVINIREVLHSLDFNAAIRHVGLQHLIHQRRDRMSEVGLILWSYAAYVHPDGLPDLQERLDLSSECVV